MTAINLRISVVLEPDGDGYHAYCPALKGLHVDGKSEQEAMRNVKQAIAVYLKSLARHGDPLPIGADLTLHAKTRVPDRAKTRNLDIEWPTLQMSGASSRT